MSWILKREGAYRLAVALAQRVRPRRLGQAWYRRVFLRPHALGNTYMGRFDGFAQALAALPADARRGYDVDETAVLYRGRHVEPVATDFPVLFWLRQAIDAGARRVFDLGGHIGVSYYGAGRVFSLPPDLRWSVHDTPSAMAFGRRWAADHDPGAALSFADSPGQADGCDVLLANGSLQYIEQPLAGLLGSLRAPPQTVVVNLLPLHLERGFVTLQNMGLAICPYRVDARGGFVDSLQSLGYRVACHWTLPERQVRVPFHPDCSVDAYHGFCFRKA